MKWILLIACLPTVLFAQEQYGAAFSNYTPTNSVFLNPSSMLDAKTWLDIHIVGAGTYANNNFVSLNGTNWVRVARTEGEGIDEDDIQYHQNKRKYHAYNRAFAQVLSAVWSQGDHAAGLFFNVRSYTSARGIPDYAAQFIENGVPEYTPQHNIDYSLKNVYVSSVNYGEIQLSYAYTFYKKHRDMLMGGISVKKFLSIGGAGANVYNMDFNVRSDSLMSVFELNADGMVTPDPQLYTKGGMGLDIGFTYQKMMGECSSYYPNSKKMGCRYLPYKYKLGFSIMDIGSVKFEEESVQFAGYSFQSYEWLNYNEQDVDEDNILDIFANQESSIDEGRVKKPYKIHLPTYISVQGDYNLWASRLYANAAIVQALPISREKFGVRRANSLMVGLRYETRILDVSLPLSLYEYRTPQIGLAVRIYCLTIGTDKLFHLVGNSKLYGGDIYAHLKIPIFYHPKCRAHKRSGRDYDPGKIRRRKDGCDAYN
ncbi:MAG TPA: DUF5723 family protein [Fluviicola sp.]|nr:DUF5723 family protein [Fluviicola sp.]